MLAPKEITMTDESEAYDNEIVEITLLCDLDSDNNLNSTKETYVKGDKLTVTRLVKVAFVAAGICEP